MKTRNLFLLYLVIYLNCSIGFTQANYQSELIQDTSFFNNQLIVFSNWLKRSDLDSLISIRRMRVENKNLILELNFNFKQPEIASEAWQKLNIDFADSNYISLNTKLFYKFIDCMEVPKELARIRLKGQPFTENNNLNATIFYDTDSCRVITPLESRTTTQIEKKIENFKVKKCFLFAEIKSTDTIDILRKRYEIYKYLLEKSKEYFTSKGENVKFTELENSDILVFDVIDIKEEVISNSLLINPHEKLQFIIKYVPKNKYISIFCTIDGKIGSGLRKPRTIGNYRDLEENYKPDLDRYIRKFTSEKIIRWLTES